MNDPMKPFIAAQVEPVLKSKLKEHAVEKGISESEVIRRAVEIELYGGIETDQQKE